MAGRSEHEDPAAEISKYLSVLKNVRVSCRVPSSVYVAEGGYIRESGESCEIVPRPMKNRPGREPPPESKRRPSRCFIKPERDFTGNCSP
ncbi:MAG: hypothetical protein II953_08030 [Clostridia bacterium]|nr:hypothetical protein [Clostridia bacterium]